MIGLELAYAIPERFASLTLMVTSAGSTHWWNNMSPLTGCLALAKYKPVVFFDHVD